MIEMCTIISERSNTCIDLPDIPGLIALVENSPAFFEGHLEFRIVPVIRQLGLIRPNLFR